METQPTGDENVSRFKFQRSENDPKLWTLETAVEIEGRKLQFILESGILEFLSENPTLVKDIEHDLTLILPDFFHRNYRNIPGNKEDPLRVTLLRSQEGGLLFRLNFDNKPPRENA